MVRKLLAATALTAALVPLSAVPAAAAPAPEAPWCVSFGFGTFWFEFCT